MARPENSGEYDERITICKQILGQTQTGTEYQGTPEPIKTLWAKVNTFDPSLVKQAARKNINADITFKVRYGKAIDDIIINPQDYLVLFKGLYYTVKFTDDYLFRHDRIVLYCSKDIGGNNGQRV